jgi:hypothetical protein
VSTIRRALPPPDFQGTRPSIGDAGPTLTEAASAASAASPAADHGNENASGATAALTSIACDLAVPSDAASTLYFAPAAASGAKVRVAGFATQASFTGAPIGNENPNAPVLASTGAHATSTVGPPV